MYICVSEMCNKDLQSWGWTDLCVPPSVVSECTWLLVFTDLFETLIQTFMAAFTLLILHSATLTRPECGITLDLEAARFGLAGLGLQRKSYSDMLMFASEH